MPEQKVATSTLSTPVEQKATINWVATILFSTTFLGCITVVPWYGIVYGYSAAAWIWGVVFLYFCGLSITGGYHRLWAHSTYEAHWSLRLFYIIGGAMALQNSVLVWSSGHRDHHRFIDDNDLDPYSAKRGLWFSHIGWMLRNYPSGEPDFSKVRDLERDPLVAFQHRHYLALVLATNIGLPLLVGWLAGDVWGVFLIAGLLRLVVNHHVTWFINSLAHYWGTQPYTDENTARDNHFLAFLTYGEGYHNFHHIFARDYRNGVRWFEWDPTKWMIKGLSYVGITRNLHEVPAVTIERAKLAMQFSRAQRRLESLGSDATGGGRHQLDKLRALLAHESEAFSATMAEWSKRRDEWYADARQRLAQKWEQANFRAYAREIEKRLREQRRRMRQLTVQLAAAQPA